MALRAGGDGAPHSQACVICWNWPALGLLDCNVGSGCLLDVVGWGFAGQDPLVSSSSKSIFLILRYCLADPRKPYVEMTSLWGSAVTYGEMRQACGCMGKPRYRMGRRPMCGEAVESHGERKSHEKPEYGSGRRRLGMGPPDRMGRLSQWQTWRDLRTLHIFATNLTGL